MPPDTSASIQTRSAGAFFMFAALGIVPNSRHVYRISLAALGDALAQEHGVSHAFL